MKVKELIEELKKHDQESMVVVRGYEGGVDKVTNCEATQGYDNPQQHREYEGEYETQSHMGRWELDKMKDAVTFPIVWLWGTNRKAKYEG